MLHVIFSDICDELSEFIPLVQFKKRAKHPWSVTFIKLQAFSLSMGVFQVF